MMNIYKGCIEDNKDPQKMGRVRIRVLGIHTEQKEQSADTGIPTEDLPWANPIWPIFSSANTGIGAWNVPEQGSWVACLSEDDSLQRWFYIGTISAFPREISNPDLGFNDPDGTYPLSDRIGEPDLNRIARNDKVDETPVGIRVREVVKKIPVAALLIRGGDISSFEDPTIQNTIYEEPVEPYAVQYPHNFVYESSPGMYKNGHVIEIDSTPDKERIAIWHKAGTFSSIHWNGQTVKKVISDDYSFVLGSKYEYVNYDVYTTVWGDDRKLIRSNKQEEIYGYLKQYVKGNTTQYVSGDVSIWIGSGLVDDPNKPEWSTESRKKDGSLPEVKNKTTPTNAVIGGNLAFTTENNVHARIKGNEHVTIDGTVYVEVTGTRNIVRNRVGESGSYTIEPHGEYLVKGHKTSRIWGGKMVMNSGCVSGFTTCPFTFSPHIFSSRTVKVSF